ncbi:MAG: type II toxin-antitoxin system VapC family toxin [Coriobacteriia bacterium]|nr:type II toxin-antitoxin system VapC family toxin [Coriobacteriia bacterium]
MSRVVLDASVAIKWFRSEPGSVEARQILSRHGSGELVITVPSLFVYEFAGVATRLLAPAERDELWHRFLDWRITVREVGDALVTDSMRIADRLGCSLYDAVAPALAASLDAPLISADRRAHAEWPGVVLLG